MKRITTFLRTTSTFLIFLLVSGCLSGHESKNFSKQILFTPKLSNLAPMLEHVIPSVVSITVESGVNKFSRVSSHTSSLYSKSILFNHSVQSDKFRILGSGVIIDSQYGYIVTNSHVVDRADKIYVKLSNGSTYNAIIVGKDSRFDIALLQLKQFKTLHQIKISNSDDLRVGDYVIAIGNPYGLGETVTSGIISALHRSGLNIENYENFIQTDAAINRGNSGGALINLKGELIGINTAILAPDGGNIGIGFSIPINMVKNLVSQILKYGQIQRNELGIVGTELTLDLVKVMKIAIHRGAFVSQVLSQSSAEISGIRPGDVIISLNKKPVFSFSSLRAEIASQLIHTKVELGLLRKGKFESVLVELNPRIQNEIDSSALHKSISGAKLRNFILSGKSQGICVDDVKIKTPADHIGLKKNDIIFEINKNNILSLNDFRRLLHTHPEILVLHIKRGNEILYLVVHYY